MNPALEFTANLNAPSARSRLSCPVCGEEHRRVLLRQGDRALCVRCGALMAKRSIFGSSAAAAFTLTGLLLAVPATLLPFVTVAKFGNAHTGRLLTGVGALWDQDMRMLAIWVLLCGAVVPMLLLATLSALLLPSKFGGAAAVQRMAHALEHWAMPEVNVLAVLVSLVKLRSQVEVHIGPAFWCYAAMSAMILLAWRSFAFEAPRVPSPP
ncbi:MAG: paraquat-inducible protein A [Opitutaceae bacterium]